MNASLGRLTRLRSSFRRVQWFCPECALIYSSASLPPVTQSIPRRFIYNLRQTTFSREQGPRPIYKNPFLLQPKSRHASVQAPSTSPLKGEFLDAEISSHNHGNPPGGKYPVKEVEEFDAAQKAGKILSIRSRLKSWQEGFVRETSPMYVDQALGGDMSKIWKHSPYFGLEKGDGIAANDTELAKAQDTYLDEDEDIEDQLQMQEGVPDQWQDAPILRPGDLIALRSLAFKDPAVVVQCRGPDMLIYCLSGRWQQISQLKPSDIAFREPRFADTDMIEPILSFVPPEGSSESSMKFLEGAIPRTVASPLLERLQEHIRKAKSFYMMHARELDHIWESLAYDDEELPLSLDDVSSRLLKQPCSDLAAPALHALAHALHSDLLNISIKYAGRFSGKLFSFRSKQEFWMLQKIFKWVRDYQDSAAIASHGRPVDWKLKVNPLHLFITNARQAVLKSRSYRSPTMMGGVGPTATNGTNVTQIQINDEVLFSDTDKEIIRFMVVAYGPVTTRSSLIKSNASIILRAVGAYPEMVLSVVTGRLFLKELGYFAPWEFTKLHDPYERIPDNGSSPSLDSVLAKAREIDASTPFDYIKDLNPGPRKDWANLVAFRVDSDITTDYDDAFSLERATGADDSWWLHSHIADPTAFVSPDHPLVEFAAMVRSSLYLRDRKVAMLPPNFTSRLSVGPNQPVLTFSSLIRSDGEIIETKITPGIIRQVVSLTPKGLKTFLFGELCNPIRLTIGPSIGHTKQCDFAEHEKLEPHRKTLEKFAELARAMKERRNSSGRLIQIDSRRFDASVSISHLPSLKVNGDLPCSRTFQGDPSIHVAAIPKDHPEHDVDIVGEVMVNANTVAARWCKDRSIPIPFMKTEYHPDFPLDRLQSMDETEFRRFPTTRKSVNPAPHDSVVVDQYTQATSPLRRYNDLVVHWQIRGALLHDYRSGRPGNDNNVSLQADLPFTKSDIERSIAEYEYYEKTATRTAYGEKCHWVLQALFRAIHFKEGEIPEVMYMRVKERKILKIDQEAGLKGYLAPFEVPAVLLKSSEGFESNIDVHDIVACRISRVEIDAQFCLVVPIGPPLKPTIFDGMSSKHNLEFTLEEYHRLLTEHGKACNSLLDDQ